MNHAAALYQIADELREIASSGLHFAKDDYDTQRYKKVLAASARIITALEGGNSDALLAQFQDNLFHASPSIGVDALVFRDGKLLLIQRADNQLWALPGGWVEIGETLAEAVQRELWEETGIRGEARRLFGIFDSRIWGSMVKSHLYHCMFEVVAENPQPGESIEILDSGFFDEADLPRLAPGHDKWVPLTYQMQRGEVPIPYFDLASPDKKENKA